MRTILTLLLGAVLLAHAPAYAQEQPRRGEQFQKQGLQPRDRPREERREFRRDRAEREDGERGRFSREERDQLRQDLLDANREMKRRR